MFRISTHTLINSISSLNLRNNQQTLYSKVREIVVQKKNEFRRDMVSLMTMQDCTMELNKEKGKSHDVSIIHLEHHEKIVAATKRTQI